MRKAFVLLSVLAVALAAAPPVPAAPVSSSSSSGQALVFHELTPCVLFDTRPALGGTGALAGGESRTFHVVGSSSDFAAQGGTAGGCGIPGFSGGSPQTDMVFLNLVAVEPAGGGNLKVWASDVPEPDGGVVNYQQYTPRLNNSNALAVGVRKDVEGNDITVKANVSGTHVRGVALGYLAPAPQGAAAWLLGGNSGTDPATHFVGTTDNTPLNFRVNDARALRLEPGDPPNVIGGWSGNNTGATVVGAAIGGGGCPSSHPFCSVDGPNRVTADFGTVAGGQANTAGGFSSTVGGGQANTASAGSATVSGGSNNSASGPSATVGGGVGNSAGGSLFTSYATVGGGSLNTASNTEATVAGGNSNTASGFRATVGGGTTNEASGSRATVGGGVNNQATNEFATVPGGVGNTAGGAASFAAGRFAKANHHGAFVWGDNTAANVTSSAENEFTVRASGGTRIYSSSDLSTGVTLAPGGGSWASVSDRAVKANLRSVSPGEILAKVAALPISTWNYTSQDASIRHIGPTAQDFHRAFEVGEDDRHITAVDADGVALAAIQGLHKQNEAQQAEIADLRADLTSSRGAPAGGPPAAALWALAAAVGLLGLGLGVGLGRRWGKAVLPAA